MSALRILIVLWLFIQCGTVAAENKSYQLMLIGGELPYCRSSELNLCSPQAVGKFNQSASRRSPLYRISSQQIKQVMAPSLWHSSRQVTRHDLNKVLLQLSKVMSNKAISKALFLKHLRNTKVTSESRYLNGYTLLASLTNNEKAMLLDFFELEQLDHFAERVLERVNLADPQYINSVALLKRVVTQAKLINNNATPKILIVTAGDRDSFRNVDSWQDIFNQLGAQTQWLPIDTALNKAISGAGTCSKLALYRNSLSNNFSRQRMYPDLTQQQLLYCNKPQQMNELVKNADAIIFTGQSPALLKRSFRTVAGKKTELISLIKSRMLNQQLFVVAIGGATLAMTGDVDYQQKPIAMVRHGSSEMAFTKGATALIDCIDDVDCPTKVTGLVGYDPDGGIGLFSAAVIDVEVSSKSNFGRLAKISFDNQNMLAIGIDRFTALLVNVKEQVTHFEVAGQGGISLISHNNTLKSKQGFGLQNIALSYYTLEDRGIISANNISVDFADWKKTPSILQGEEVKFNHLFLNNNFSKFSKQACLSHKNKWVGFAGRERRFQIELTKSSHSELKFGGIKNDDSFELYCSFKNLQLSILRRQ